MEPLPCESSTVPPSSGPRPRPVRPPRRRRARRTCGRPTSRGRGGPRAGPPPAPWRRWCALAVPYVRDRPAWIMDDWRLLAQRDLYGVVDTAGPALLGTGPSPGFTFSHGVVGPHPLVHFLLLTVLNVGVAMVIFFALCPWVRRHLAFAVACVWVVLPNHTSLSYWPSTLPALLALIGSSAASPRSAGAGGGSPPAPSSPACSATSSSSSRPPPRSWCSPPPAARAGRPSRRSEVASWPWPGGCWRTPPIPRNASRAYLRTATSAASACCGRATSVRPPRGPRQPGGPGGRRPHRRDPGDRPLRP